MPNAPVVRERPGQSIGGRFAAKTQDESPDVTLDDPAAVAPPVIEPLPEKLPGSMEELKRLVGPVTADQLGMAPEHALDRSWDAMRRLSTAEGADWQHEAQNAIHSSALMGGFRGNHWGEHAVASYAAEVSDRRAVAAGHDPRCNVHSAYDRAHRRVVSDEGYSPGPRAECICAGASK